jgi:group I intron endonuclease
MTCGIYCIENLVNGKKYVGQSLKIESRFDQHTYDLNNGNHKNGHLQNAWKKYHKKNFKFYIIEECSGKELNKKECFYIKEWNTISPNGYNFIDGGGKQRKRYDSSSKYLGVSRLDDGYFLCQMLSFLEYDFNGYIGRYKKEEWAAMAYDLAAIQLYGKKCKLNFPKHKKIYLEIIDNFDGTAYPEDYVKYLSNDYFKDQIMWREWHIESGESYYELWFEKDI